MKRIKVKIKGNDGVDEGAVRVSDDEVYKMSQQLIRMRDKIKLLKGEIIRLTKIRDGLQCKEPTTHDLLQYCDSISDATKGKYGDKKK